MTDYERMLATLRDQGVKFVIVGGVAATLHGSSRLTTDLDVVYDRSTGNIGGYNELEGHTVEVDLFGSRYRCIDVDTLIRAKRAAGRPKDLEVVAELEKAADTR